MNSPSPIQIAESILGHIDWINGSKGYCTCPGQAMHTNRNARRDCRVFLDGAPTIHCVHSSCDAKRAEVNRELRVTLGKYFPGRRIASSAPRQNNEALKRRAAASLPEILQAFRLSVESFAQSSPEVVHDDALEQYRLLLSLFNPDDVIWMGDRYHSGSELHRTHFRTAAEWGACTQVAGPLVVPNTFKPGVHGRSALNVHTLCFLVVESDVLGKEEVIAVFRWLAQSLRLRVVVDTAGKSLHGWFDYPEPAHLEDLKVILPALKCDPKMFGIAQPCRLAGALRPDKDYKRQSLLWLDRGGVR